MAQVSRPFQVVLAAFVLFAIAWFALLHRPASGSSSGSSSANVAHPAAPHPHAPLRAGAAAAAGRHAAQPSNASGRPSATRTASHAVVRSDGHTVASTAHHTAVRAASHTAVRTSSHTAVRTSSHTAVRTSSHTAVVGASHKPVVAQRPTQPAPHHPATSTTTTSRSAPSMQAAVAGELKQNKVVLLLFWNSKSSADNAVHQQVEIVAHKLGRSVVVHTASAGQVGDFGSITREIQVYQTPTLLIVNPKAQVTTVTGYTDAYALEQTIREARG